MWYRLSWAFCACLLLQVLRNLHLAEGNVGSNSNGHRHETSPIECPPNDEICQKDKLGFEAVQTLHLLVDDDQNGNLDRSESDEFIRDELKYEDGFERHTTFHGNDDQISVIDLWNIWKTSEVHNWTVDDMIDWLVDYVELPQYTEGFRVNAVDGHVLPRIAASAQYASNIIGVKNPVHKKKLTVKAMDAVLFGPPKGAHSYIKDLMLVALLLVSVGGCWLAYVQHRYSQSHLSKVMQDLDALQKSEDALFDLKKQLAVADKEKKDVDEERRTMEQRAQEAKAEAERLKTMRDATEEDLIRFRLLEEENTQLLRALKKVEEQLATLPQWLQLTYEVENRYYDTKREAAEKQLAIAKEMCEKIKRKRSSVLGSFRIAHTQNMDDTDHNIVKARAALEELKQDLQERAQRWSQMESICGCNITINPGLPYLESLLRGGNTYFLRQGGTTPSIPSDMDFADDDSPPNPLAYSVAFYNQTHGGAVVRPTTLPGMLRSNEMRAALPSLMKAGMQLSMLSLGATPRTAGAMKSTLPRTVSAPAKSLDPLAAKRPNNLNSNVLTFGSTGSLTGASGNRSPRQGRIIATSDDLVSNAESQDLEGDDLRSKVMFDVAGDVGQYTQFISNQNGDSGSHRDDALNTRSVSMEVPKTNRPKVMPSSYSEGSILHNTSNNSSVYKRNASQSSLSPNNPITEEENSSPESTDSNMSREEPTKRKKKKGKLIRKLFGNDTEKTK